MHDDAVQGRYLTTRTRKIFAPLSKIFRALLFIMGRNTYKHSATVPTCISDLPYSTKIVRPAGFVAMYKKLMCFCSVPSCGSPDGRGEKMRSKSIGDRKIQEPTSNFQGGP